MTRSEVQKILDAARQLDPGYALFGAKKHQYRLRPPLAPALIHKIETRHGLELPEDYVYFLTEIGDGGAGPDYGIDSFAEQFRETGQKYCKNRTTMPKNSHIARIYRNSASGALAARRVRGRAKYRAKTKKK